MQRSNTHVRTRLAGAALVGVAALTLGACSGAQRHLLVSVAEGFRVLDTGVEVRGHDDHVHLYGHDPKLTDVVFPAPKPGHAVVHADKLALFSDEAGTIQVLDPHDLTEPASSQLHAVHLPTAKVVDSVTLPHVPNQIADVGLAAEGHDHD